MTYKYDPIDLHAVVEYFIEKSRRQSFSELMKFVRNLRVNAWSIDPSERIQTIQITLRIYQRYCNVLIIILNSSYYTMLLTFQLMK
jgi:hypothetical protein